MGKLQIQGLVTGGSIDSRPSLGELHGEVGQTMTPLICACWQNSQEARPTMGEVLGWLQELQQSEHFKIYLQQSAS